MAGFQVHVEVHFSFGICYHVFGLYQCFKVWTDHTVIQRPLRPESERVNRIHVARVEPDDRGVHRVEYRVPRFI